MAPRKKNLNKRNTVKVPYAVLYTRETAEDRPKAAGQDAAPEPAPGGGRREAAKSVPPFAKKK